jgi:subtilisin family serine protease
MVEATNPFTPRPRRARVHRLAWRDTIAVILAGACSVAAAQSPGAKAAAPAAAPAAASSAGGRFRPVSLSVSRRQQVRSEHAVTYYSAAWGVQDMAVRYTASGNLIRFSYKVVDPARAKALFDKGSQPVLFSQRSHALLQIPVMDKVGPLRQANDLAPGKEYWMAFSNKGNLVRPGDRVNVIIGAFHADGLLVE